VKFGVLQFFSWPGRRGDLTRVYRQAFDRIDVMDQGGYDAVWLAEHHFSTYSVCPSVHMMGTHIAARTQSLRIGTAVSLAAFYHPLRLAEEVALLDVLSNGRVNWGAGRGFDRTEFDCFGVAPGDSYERFRENVDIVMQAWRPGPFSYEGKWHQFQDVEVLPRPLQEPHPPVWLASSSPEAIAWAASRGDSILMDPHSSFTEIGRKYAYYGEELAKYGHDLTGRDTPMARLVSIAKQRSEAEETARRGVQWLTGSYAAASRGAQISDLRSNEAREKGEEALLDGSHTDPSDRYLAEAVLWGTPEEVADKLVELSETISLHYLLAAPLSHETFVLLTEEVLPRIT
jgi:alkanesulfonate monooxygenase SsuD/methylene tetrahydromethanopterin reductase-like flavin-dependent oxidoreductase (luciferase family)